MEHAGTGNSTWNTMGRETARGTQWDGKQHVEHTGTGNSLASPATTQREQCWHIVTDGRKQSEGLVIAVLASVVRVNDAPRNTKELPPSPHLFPTPKRRLENCQAWTSSLHVVDPMIRSEINTHGLPLPDRLARIGGGVRMCLFCLWY